MADDLIQLRGGHSTEDRRLDRIPQYDERSRLFQVRTLLDAPRTTPGTRGTVARYPAYPSLDQGEEGACVTFSRGTLLNASPHRRRPRITNLYARSFYFEVQQHDEYPGGAYPNADPFMEGTSVLAGLQRAQARGLIGSYWWCGAGSGTAIDDVVDAVRNFGDVQFGIPWYRSMYETDRNGVVIVDPSSGLAGYHAIGSHTFRYAPLPGRGSKKVEHLVWQNTWGDGYGVPWYGVPGHGFVTLEDIEAHLLPRAVYGEAAVAMPPGR